jgi:hypothetical protein
MSKVVWRLQRRATDDQIGWTEPDRDRKAVISLTTGLADVERLTVAFLVTVSD